MHLPIKTLQFQKILLDLNNKVNIPYYREFFYEEIITLIINKPNKTKFVKHISSSSFRSTQLSKARLFFLWVLKL